MKHRHANKRWKAGVNETQACEQEAESGHE